MVIITDQKNIFEIWKDNGKRLPFAVRRVNWTNQYYTIVTGIKIKKWPYGDAYGYPTVMGVYSDHYEYEREWRENQIIPCCGCYQWHYVKNPLIIEDDYQRFIANHPSVNKENPKKRSQDTYQITYRLLQEDTSVEEISKIRGLTIGTIYSHIGELLSRGFPLDVDDFVPKEKQLRIIDARDQIKEDKLKILKEYLGNDYSYEDIRLTLIANKK